MMLRRKGFCFIVIFGLIWIVVHSCSSDKNSVRNECDTYECRRESFKVRLIPQVIDLGDASTLEVKREKFYLPQMRVFLGEFVDDFDLQDKETLFYFEGQDSIASTTLLPESSGVKKIRGVIEEFRRLSEDSVYSFYYPFEVELQVRDTVAHM